MNTPGITAICMTHGRWWLLAEAVESFRRQQLGDLRAEMWIVNDCPACELVCDVPGVRVLQGMEPFPDLSEKYNWTLARLESRYWCVWDDDDISLPGRLAQGVAMIGDHDAFRPKLCWNWGRMCWAGAGTIRGLGQPLTCSATFSTAACREVGGCTIGQWSDKSLWEKIWPRRNCLQIEQAPHEIQFVYRWAGIGYHDSGAGDPNAFNRAKNFREAMHRDKLFRYGRVEIEPVWHQDYCQLVRVAIQQGKGAVRL